MISDYALEMYAFRKYELVDRDVPDAAMQASIKAAKFSMQYLLTDVQKKYIEDYVFEGIPMPEIALKYGVNKSSVSRGIKAGLKKMKFAIACSNPVFMKCIEMESI